ncbi:MAG: metallophosphoesterase [Parachlamydiales bacterium]|jgi:cytolysin (calcineurin-like family phosphatase)
MKKIFFLTCFITYLEASVTFFVGTDPHYGQEQLSSNEEINKQVIYDMNQLPNQNYPEFFGGTVQSPKAVIVTGDLTDMGSFWQWYGLSLYFRFLQLDGFISDYGLNGENLLNFPVFEGYGNHDNLAWLEWVQDSIKYRNQNRKENINISENGLHYSWDWEGVHFIQLNIYPGDSEEAEQSLTFLKYDLQNNLKDPKTPLVLFHHYGFDGYSDDWWTSEERENYYQVIKDYNVAAIFQGHQHSVFHIVWKGIDVFSSGAMKDNSYFVCQIDDKKLKIINRENGSWGDWHFEKEIVQ